MVEFRLNKNGIFEEISKELEFQSGFLVSTEENILPTKQSFWSKITGFISSTLQIIKDRIFGTYNVEGKIVTDIREFWFKEIDNIN